MQKQKIGVIGWLYHGHMHTFYNNDFGTTVAACDTNVEIVKRFQADHPEAGIFTDYREMAEKEALDAVIISTPNWLHREMAVYFLERGINVFLEKPMGINREEIDAILAAQMKSGKICAVDFEMRVSREHRRIKEIISSGEIGEPCGFEFIHHRGAWLAEGRGVWRTKPEMSGGLAMMEGCHRIDAARSLLGEVTHVQSFSFPNVLPQYNHGNMRDNEIIHLWFEKNRRGMILHSHTSSVFDAGIQDYAKLGHDYGYIITGSEGCIRVNINEKSVLVCCYEDYHPDAKKGRRAAFKKLEDYSAMSEEKFDHDIVGNHMVFIKCCATGEPFHQSTLDAWKTHVVCLAADKSADEGSSRIPVDYRMPV